MKLALECEVLQFGEFELKSGRVSPYFFNAGKISSGAALARLGRCYAAALSPLKLSPDMLFGPAYKGIPLVAAQPRPCLATTILICPLRLTEKKPKRMVRGAILWGQAPRRRGGGGRRDDRGNGYQGVHGDIG